MAERLMADVALHTIAAVEEPAARAALCLEHSRGLCAMAGWLAAAVAHAEAAAEEQWEGLVRDMAAEHARELEAREAAAREMHGVMAARARAAEERWEAERRARDDRIAALEAALREREREKELGSPIPVDVSGVSANASAGGMSPALVRARALVRRQQEPCAEDMVDAISLHRTQHRRRPSHPDSEGWSGAGTPVPAPLPPRARDATEGAPPLGMAMATPDATAAEAAVSPSPSPSGSEWRQRMARLQRELKSLQRDIGTGPTVAAIAK